MGAKTLSAANSREAMKVVDQQNIDVILTDVRMPDGDGIDLLSQITTLKSPPLFFVMTGFADIELEDAKRMGAITIFTKPCDFQIIASEISSHFSV